MEYGGFGGGFDPMGFNQYGGGGFMPETTVTSPEAKVITHHTLISATIMLEKVIYSLRSQTYGKYHKMTSISRLLPHTYHSLTLCVYLMNIFDM